MKTLLLCNNLNNWASSEWDHGIKNLLKSRFPSLQSFYMCTHQKNIGSEFKIGTACFCLLTKTEWIKSLDCFAHSIELFIIKKCIRAPQLLTRFSYLSLVSHWLVNFITDELNACYFLLFFLFYEFTVRSFSKFRLIDKDNYFIQIIKPNLMK